MRKIALSAIAFAVVMSATAVTHAATAAVTNKESKTLAQSVSEPAKDAKKPSETTRVIVKVAEGDSLSSIAEKNRPFARNWHAKRHARGLSEYAR